MPEYLFVIWEGGEGAEQSAPADMMAEMATYATDLAAKGKLKGGAPVQPPAQSVTVRRRRGQLETVDGPYIETKEVMGGYFIVEAASMVEAVDLARGCPGAAYGAVEVREQIAIG